MKIVIVANETKKTPLIEWSYANKKILEQHSMIATGACAHILEGVLLQPVHQLSPVTTGGITEIEKMVVAGEVDMLIFFPSLQDQSVVTDKFRHLVTISSEKDILIAFNTSTADLLLHHLHEAKTASTAIDTLKALG